MNERIVIKRFKLRAPYGSPLLVFLWPLFWCWLITNILTTKPKLIYSCNLDTAIPCYISKILLFNKPRFVFDSFDKFSLGYIPPNYKLICKIVDLLENILAASADAFITVSYGRLATYGKFIPQLVGIIMNCPEDMLPKINYAKLIHKDPNELILVYAGALNKDRGLALLKEAISRLNNVKLYLAGFIYDDTLKKLFNDPKIHYLDLLKYEEAIALQAQADVIPILYDPTLPINCVANPNKLFEAMMLGKPVITNVCKDLVIQTACGLVVDYNCDSVRKAIVTFLKNYSLRKNMSINARKSFEEKYNWTIMEKRLLNIIHKLLH